MNRIAQNNLAPTHPEANKWLTELMINLKKMLYLEENYQPFTMDFLNEWSGKHHSDVESCGDYESAMVKRISDEIIPEHIDAMLCFTQIVTDLKLIVSGQEPIRPFTDERMKEADKYYGEIHDCRKRRTIFY